MYLGFTKSRSCQTSPTALSNKRTDFPDKGNAADLIWHDFRIAFGTVPFSKLFAKMVRMRVNTRILKWNRWLENKRIEDELFYKEGYCAERVF